MLHTYNNLQSHNLITTASPASNYNRYTNHLRQSKNVQKEEVSFSG